MPHPPAAPAEADALRPLAQAVARARLPATLKLLLLALLAAWPARTPRHPRKDWYLARHGESVMDSESDLPAHVLRAIRRHRAFIGWILRCDRAEGMALSGRRALTPCPIRTARAPP